MFPFRKMIFVCSFLCTVVYAEAANLPPGVTRVDAADLVDNALRLPEIGGSIAAPSREWTWYKVPGKVARQFVCMHSTERPLFVIVDRAETDITKITMTDVRKGTINAVSMHSIKFVGEHGELTRLPSHEVVFRARFILQAEREMKMEQYYLSNGRYLILCGSEVSNEVEQHRLKMFADSLRFKMVSKEQKAFYAALAYFLIGTVVFWAVRLVNYLSKRVIASAPMCAFVAVFLFVLVAIKAKPDVEPGYQIGLAFLPLLTFGGMWWQQRRRQSSTFLIKN
jgi:hypothetical protein